MNRENKYNDIIDMPHHQSAKRHGMSMIDRAAQFSPFAALTGHSAALQETARLTDNRTELDEGEKAIINEKLQMIMNVIAEEPEAVVTHFEPDSKKSGGAYLNTVGRIKKIDTFKHEIAMTDGRIIPVEHIRDIQSGIFGNMLDF